VPEWDEDYFAQVCEDDQNVVNGSAQATMSNESDLGRTQVTSCGKYQNTFTITEIQ
jgi:hypothetical protein